MPEPGRDSLGTLEPGADTQVRRSP